jgi:hypothetical protein
VQHQHAAQFDMRPVSAARGRRTACCGAWFVLQNFRAVSSVWVEARLNRSLFRSYTGGVQFNSMPEAENNNSISTSTASTASPARPGGSTRQTQQRTKKSTETERTKW